MIDLRSQCSSEEFEQNFWLPHQDLGLFIFSSVLEHLRSSLKKSIFLLSFTIVVVMPLSWCVYTYGRDVVRGEGVVARGIGLLLHPCGSVNAFCLLFALMYAQIKRLHRFNCFLESIRRDTAHVEKDSYTKTTLHHLPHPPSRDEAQLGLAGA